MVKSRLDERERQRERALIEGLSEREAKAIASQVSVPASQGVPMAGALVPLFGLLIIAGGLMVLLGVWADLGALFLILFLLPTAFFMHAFWKSEDANEKANQMAHFMKNLVMAGGALIAFALFAYLGDSLGLTITGPVFDLR